MNYRVFYQSQSADDFQNDNAYVAELVQAIDDAVADGADVISNSWGSTLPEHARRGPTRWWRRPKPRSTPAS